MASECSFSLLPDIRVDGFSVLVTHTVGEYLDRINVAFRSKGGIEGQRPTLKTTAATRIRRRMIDDFRRGAVLPPVVIGVVEQDHKLLHSESTREEFDKFLAQISPEQLSLIDGMQRTTAMREAVEQDPSIRDRLVRVEYWIAKTTNSLVYRMLVLNTGQVPWPLKRQLEVVYASLVKDIEQKVSFEKFITVDARKRRYSGGQLSASDAVELFMSFGLRKEKVDTQEQLAEEFSRLDIIEATARTEYSNEFMAVLQLLINMDIEFSRYKPEDQPADEALEAKISRGRHVFDKQPARIGFVAACAQYVFGRPGKDKSESQIETDFKNLLRFGNAFIDRISLLNEEGIGDFLDLETLDSLLSYKRTGKVGDFERSFFLAAFSVLLQERFEIDKMTMCWRAL